MMLVINKEFAKIRPWGVCSNKEQIKWDLLDCSD